MQKLKQIYRANYAGENIVTELTLSNNEWTPVTEFVPNSVFNTHSSTQAIAIGNGESRLTVDLSFIKNHKGGLLGADKLQSYGCNALYRDFTPDFLVATGDKIVKEIADSGYTNDHIVYTTGKNVIDYPGKFYLIPQNLQYDSGAIAAYLAAFDGHKKIFLLGYDGYDTPSPVNNIYKNTNGYPKSTDIQNEAFWNSSLEQVIKTYYDIDFVSVMPTKTWYVSTQFDVLPNFRQIDFREFIIEADLG
ncbi:hypothetical protein UFOVP112_157 [uncultured Caudovirales phage]|uniref:Uncharacterized protein n=1 Tax=uncultured Caudovirales phage TaxID=2100421 RepID=A0A6J5LBC0_9CAUD|nr:hypothetical protein UFOVP112_157 [uncultured Caudovirales phage]